MNGTILNINGMDGGYARHTGTVNNTARMAIVGKGGDSQMGSADHPAQMGQTGFRGSPSIGFGAGGNGVAGSNQANTSGGDGADGVVIVYEYY